VIDPSWALKLWSSRRRAALGRQEAGSIQRRVLTALVRRAAPTAFGRAHDFASIRTVEDYQRRVALRDYEAFWSQWWRPAFPHVGGVTWPGPIRYFANSSGTTQASTKRIPLSEPMVRDNRLAALDVLAWHLQMRPNDRPLSGYGVFLGGSTKLEALAPGIQAGDLSAIATVERPVWARGRVLPGADLARLTDWRMKMERLASVALKRPIRTISGTTSWMLLFFEIAAAVGRTPQRLRDLFPALELLVHGGVGFAPYRDRFANWLEGSTAVTREVYAASEGFIAIADRAEGDGLRLLLDRGLFYEFVDPAQVGSASCDRRWIGNADLGKPYALVLTTNSGLWSYVLGDTVCLVSRAPPRILITGRLVWTLSVAGEHLSGAELDTAISEAARALGCRVVEFSAAPVHPDSNDARAGHLFAVELDRPTDPLAFGRALDAALQRVNDDYAAHRAGDFGLRPPEVRLLPAGSFERWMELRGKLGSQNKVPRVVPTVEALAQLLPVTNSEIGGEH
jgi:hypothetical protein